MSEITRKVVRYPDTPNGIVAHLMQSLEERWPNDISAGVARYPYKRGILTVAEQVGERRETLWRYKTGTVRAPFEIVVKIMAAVGIKLVVATADPAS